jgi:hypothetical protein
VYPGLDLPGAVLNLTLAVGRRFADNATLTLG